MVFSAIFALAAVFSVGCGKKGPPLAPLVKLPVPPADLAALRRGDTVDVSFTVPAVNTDGTRPANVASADVYAITAPVTVPPMSDEILLKLATKVGSVEVKAPADPNVTADADDPSDEVDAPEGPGLDQGAVARVKEPLTHEMLTPVVVPADKHAPPAPSEARSGSPLLGPQAVPVRTYIAFGKSTRGRKGPLSKRISVPLVPPPPPPSGAKIIYNETAITLTWSPVAVAAAAPSEGDLLPSRVIGAPRPTITYNVYDATNADAAVKLTEALLHDRRGRDDQWGGDRERAAAAGLRNAGRHVSSRCAEGGEFDFSRGRHQSDLGAERRKRSCRLHRAARRRAGRNAPADHAGADRGAVVHRQGAAGYRVCVCGARRGPGRQHQRCVGARRRHCPMSATR